MVIKKQKTNMQSNTNKKVIEKCCEKCKCPSAGEYCCAKHDCPCHTPSSEKKIYTHTDIYHKPDCNIKNGKCTCVPDEAVRECNGCEFHSSPQPSSWATDNLVEKTAYEYLRVDLKITEWQARLIAGKLGVCADNLLLQAQTEEKRRLVGEIEGLEYDFYKIPLQYAITPKDEKIYKEVLKYIINLINK